MTDQRIKLMNEVIEGIELVKMYAWETKLIKILQQKREEEIKALQKIYNFLTFVRGFIDASVLISIFVILVPYVLMTGKQVYPE